DWSRARLHGLACWLSPSAPSLRSHVMASSGNSAIVAATAETDSELALTRHRKTSRRSTDGTAAVVDSRVDLRPDLTIRLPGKGGAQRLGSVRAPDAPQGPGRVRAHERHGLAQRVGQRGYGSPVAAIAQGHGHVTLQALALRPLDGCTSKAAA